MSATGRNLEGHERRADDFYETPAWCVHSIVPFLDLGSAILDPCCGKGAILRLFDAEFPRWGLELNLDRAQHAYQSGAGQITCANSLTMSWGAYRGAAIVTNPPYKLALDFILHALDQGFGRDEDAAFLLRLNFLASQGRAAFHRRHPSDVFVLPRRPSFTEDGKTDTTEYAWCVWGPGRGGRWAILPDPQQ